MTTSTLIKQEKTAQHSESRQFLLDTFAGDDKPELFTILRHVSSSGMTRHISIKYIKNGQLMDLTWHAARVLDWSLVDGFNRAIKVGGCGMDMGFHLVYSLSCALYGSDHDNAYKLKQNWI